MNGSLYGIVDTTWCLKNGLVHLPKLLRITYHLALSGVPIIQLRAKNSPKEEILLFARKLQETLFSFPVTFIINDFVEIASKIENAGVHLGQEDGDLREARAVLGKERKIGRSTHSLEQAKKALEEGADYIGFGPIFPTPTKPGRTSVGLAALKEVVNSLPSEFPIYAIGGINSENIDACLATGVTRISVVRDLICVEEKVSHQAVFFIEKLNFRKKTVSKIGRKF